jgi:Mn-dependent DtxR family transcriptional regulator
MTANRRKREVTTGRYFTKPIFRVLALCDAFLNITSTISTERAHIEAREMRATV